MNILIPCVICRKLIEKRVDVGTFYMFECDCGVTMVIPKKLYYEANRKASISMAVLFADAKSE